MIMNYIFISPAYPVTCTHFCERLSELGVNVLGIGDVAYDELNDRLKGALTEYYRVDSLEDYDQVFRAAAFFTYTMYYFFLLSGRCRVNTPNMRQFFRPSQ